MKVLQIIEDTTLKQHSTSWTSNYAIIAMYPDHVGEAKCLLPMHMTWVWAYAIHTWKGHVRSQTVSEYLQCSSRQQFGRQGTQAQWLETQGYWCQRSA